MFPGSVTLGQEIPSKVAIGREREPLPFSGPCLLSLVSKESRGVRWSLPLGAWTGRRQRGSPGGCCRALLGLWGTDSRRYLAASENKENRVLRDLIPFCNQ